MSNLMRQARRKTWFKAAVGMAAMVGAVGVAFQAGSSHGEEKAAANRFFEMRTYIANEGKLDALHKRFREHTNRLFVKHGMQLVGYWTPTDPEKSKDTLVYILAYPSKEARDKSWKAFRDDPEWKKVYAESHKDGVIVKKVEETFLVPTDYSPIK